MHRHLRRIPQCADWVGGSRLQSFRPDHDNSPLVWYFPPSRLARAFAHLIHRQHPDGGDPSPCDSADPAMFGTRPRRAPFGLMRELNIPSRKALRPTGTSLAASVTDMVCQNPAIQPVQRTKNATYVGGSSYMPDALRMTGFTFFSSPTPPKVGVTNQDDNECRPKTFHQQYNVDQRKKLQARNVCLEIPFWTLAKTFCRTGRVHDIHRPVEVMMLVNGCFRAEVRSSLTGPPRIRWLDLFRDVCVFLFSLPPVTLPTHPSLPHAFNRN